MGQAILSFENVYSDFKYERWDGLVTDDFIWHSNAKLYNLEELKELARGGEAFRRKNKLSLPRRVFARCVSQAPTRPVSSVEGLLC